MRDDNCIFCKIANGEIPSNVIYEDADFRVILDVSPASKGHALILPKEHAANLFELSDASAGKAIVLAKKIGAAMMQTLGCTGLNLVQNNGASAGQTVMHFHLHLIPRYDGDSAMVQWEPHASEPSVQAELAARIRAALD
ncbi:MAG: HIT family protein [Eubacteriales bacterium]|nr:HIT family protein [Eubacteriales bacterium]